MEIILSHNNLDFDGLASMMAAKKLYPQAQIIMPEKVGKNVQEFLALHKDAFVYIPVHQLDKEEITSAILVDTAGARRLGPLKSYFTEHPKEVRSVFDHHPSFEDDFSVGEGRIEEVGAVTTMLVEIIKKQGLKITPFEATLLALGIYEDTGSLIFPSTTPRDVYAAGYLLENGANLSLIDNFIDRPISAQQSALLNKLLSEQNIYHIHGYKILIATGETDNFVGGLATVTHKLAEISNADVLFSIVLMNDRIHIVARSRVDAADVGDIVGEFGGGGHPQAASAVIRGIELAQVSEKLVQILSQKVIPAVTVEKIMSSPVKTLSPHISIQEAGRIMLRYGHSGLPVVDDDKLVGIISRRDLDKAKHHGLGHAPVKAFASKKVITVNPDTPLSEVQGLMIAHDIGRMPVLKDDNLVGIVSRSDVLRTLHGEDLPKNFTVNYLQACSMKGIINVSDLLITRLPDNIYQMIVNIAKFVDEQDFQVYLVGGLVRDLLLGLPNYDLDLVVEGDGISFARLLAEKLKARLREHQKFGTAVILLPNGEKIDVATARTEYYEFPAALPTVESSSLRQDLYRRDFTINAMAVSINTGNFGELIDYFNGKEDLERRLVRVLYNLSFIEDPTRIIRAVRFEQRYGFTMEEQTLSFAKNAIDNNLVEELSFHRIREELALILHEIDPLPALRRLDDIGIWKRILPEIKLDIKTWDALKYLGDYLKYSPIQDKLNKVILYLCGLFIDVEEEKASIVLERFQWPKKETGMVQEFLDLRKKINTLEPLEDTSLADRYLQFMDYRSETLLVVGWLSSFETRKKIEKFCEKRIDAFLVISGKDMITEGVTPGPQYSSVLRRVLAAKIAGEIEGKSAELKYAINLLRMEPKSC